jgi:fimbrial isopeptide formation D2 family protein
LRLSSLSLALLCGLAFAPSAFAVSPPNIAISFIPNSVTLGQTTGLQFTTTNPNASTLTGVGFTDTLPAGLSVPNASASVCGGTVTLTSPSSISMTGATLTANTNCIFTVTVTGNIVGNYTDTTSVVTSNEGGSGNSASAGLTVTGSPTVTTAFLPNSISYGTTTGLQFDILNPGTNAATMTGISFNDTLPAGLSVPNASASIWVKYLRD